MTQNRIITSLEKNKDLLSIYFTAGFPAIDDTKTIIQHLEKSGVDMIEIGLPFSDPLADGPTIQESSKIALQNGMTTEKLFSQLKDIRNNVHIPLLIMGYFNPILQYGVAKFCKKCNEIGIDGLIIPDLPIDVFKEKYQPIFKENNLINIFLITPQTSDERIRKIDELSDGFIYMVSSNGVTGAKKEFGNQQNSYFERISKLELSSPKIVGFGISNNETFKKATQHAEGAIIGSAFIKHLKNNPIATIPEFIKTIKS